MPQAKEEFGEHDTKSDEEAFIEVGLEHFSVYRAHKAAQSRAGTLSEAPLANELVSLHEINERAVQFFYFDGVSLYKGRRRFVRSVPFDLLSIGGYVDKNRSTVGGDIWISSLKSKKYNIWYRLQSPASEYHRYHATFLWMADLAKHVVDFFHDHGQVLLTHFRKSFYEWLVSQYSLDTQVYQWMHRYKGHDFRHVVAAQANFLYCQATQVDEKYGDWPLWKEIHPRHLCAIVEQVERSDSQILATSREGSKLVSRRKTTVTPYVYLCFEHFPWGKFLHSQKPSARHGHAIVGSLSTDRKKYRNVAKISNPQERINSGASFAGDRINGVSVGDVVAVPSDKDSNWKTADSEYYGYVQNVKLTNKGKALDLLWLYRPGDTTCLDMVYPYSNELFLGDHCNCGDPPIFDNEVLHRPRVAFYGSPETTNADFFCRQQYVEGDGAWITLKEQHFRCKCEQVNRVSKYDIGDTLLVAHVLRSSGRTLE